MKKLLFIVYLLSVSYSKSYTQENEKDSIAIWIQKSKNKIFSLEEKKEYLKKAYQEVNSSNSFRVKDLSSIAYRYFILKDTLLFKKINNEVLILAEAKKDTFTLADAHWSFGEYYLRKEIYDKSYFHYNIAYENFKEINKEYETARMLYVMSFIKGRYRDYSGSEVLIFKAIEKFKSLGNNKYLYKSYNHLASLQNDIKEYDRSLFYRNKSLEYANKTKENEIYLQIIYNNKGVTYLKKENFKEAIKYFDKGLEIKTNREELSRLINNRSFAKLKIKDTINIKKDFYSALKIRDSLNDKAGIFSSKINLSKYYEYIKDTVNAFQYAKEANILAKEIKNGVDYLESLNQLAKLDPKNAKQYLDRYIQFNDSLLTVERKVQNKFTRIAFETDEYEQEAERLSEETKRLSEQKIWISASGIALLLIGSLLYFLRVQKSKNEKLLLETEQQKANEQVYLLTLKQQTILEQEKAQERNRISEELHDGVLSRLFGTRVGLGFLDFTADEATQEQHQSFLDELQDIEKEIRDVSHQLNTNFNAAEVNFTSIVNQLLKDKSIVGNFEFQLKIDKVVSWEKINELIKVNVYRIVQESLQNIVKHAEAVNVFVAFSIEKEQLILKIQDDGKGFDTKKSKKGIGMKNIKSRVQKLKGTIAITSQKNKGTLLDIKIPTA